LKKLRLKRGATLIRERDTDRSVYAVASGRLVAWTEHQGQKFVLAEFKPGDVVGELSFLDGKPRSASVSALTDCEVGVIAEAGISPQDPRYLNSMRVLVAHLVRRLRHSTKQLTSLNASLAFLKKNSFEGEARLYRDHLLDLLRVCSDLQSALEESSQPSLSRMDFLSWVRDVSQRSRMQALSFSLETAFESILREAEIEEEKVDRDKLSRELRVLNRGLLELSRGNGTLVSFEGVEALTLMLKRKELLEGEKEDELAEVLVEELTRELDESHKELVVEGLKFLSDSGWLTMQRDLKVFRCNYRAALTMNRALVFFHTVYSSESSANNALLRATR
jgi:CRP-like cAMP-binding protein